MHPAVLLVLLSLGCVAHAADATPVAETTAPIEEFAEPSEPAEQLDRKVARGKSAKFESGAAHAVWIWHDGNRWHLGTTTKSAKHRFTGFVAEGKGVELDDVSTSRTELKDRVKLRDDRVRFDFTTDGHADGFDFTVKGKGCVRFAVRVDGDPEPGMVKLGEDAVSPTSWHFRLCS
jgi:hypothetical protein